MHTLSLSGLSPCPRRRSPAARSPAWPETPSTRLSYRTSGHCTFAGGWAPGGGGRGAPGRPVRSGQLPGPEPDRGRAVRHEPGLTLLLDLAPQTTLCLAIAVV